MRLLTTYYRRWPNLIRQLGNDVAYFSRKRGERGYCVYGVKESWREGDNDDADTWEPWALNDVLYEQIVRRILRQKPTGEHYDRQKNRKR